MSHRVVTMIYCDKCEASFQGVESNRVKVAESRILARQKGWACPIRTSPFCKDICPPCAGNVPRDMDNLQLPESYGGAV